MNGYKIVNNIKQDVGQCDGVGIREGAHCIDLVALDGRLQVVLSDPMIREQLQLAMRRTQPGCSVQLSVSTVQKLLEVLA